MTTIRYKDSAITGEYDWIPKKNDGWWSRLVSDRLHRQHN